MTPARASLPQAEAPPPGTTSAPASDATGTRLHGTHPPNGSFNGTPSSSTSERLAPLGPRPRSETPCEVGFAVMLSFLRKRPKSAVAWSASSTASEPPSTNASWGITSTVNGSWERRSGSRVALTVTGSKLATWPAAAGRNRRKASSRAMRKRARQQACAAANKQSSWALRAKYGHS